MRGKRPPCLVALGDSLTEGWGLTPAQAWPSLVQHQLAAEGLPLRVVNHGVSGDTTLDGLARLGYVLDEVPGAVTVQFGANDLMQNLSPDLVERNLDTIFIWLAEAGIRAALLGVQTLLLRESEEGPAFVRVFEQAAARHRVAYEPCILKDVLGRRELLLPDGVHPNPKGMAVMTRALLPLVRDLAAGI